MRMYEKAQTAKTPWGEVKTRFYKEDVVREINLYISKGETGSVGVVTVRKWMRDLGLTRRKKSPVERAQKGGITNYLFLAKALEAKGLSPREVDEKLLLQWCPDAPATGFASSGSAIEPRSVDFPKTKKRAA